MIALEEADLTGGFALGNCTVIPSRNVVISGDQTLHLEPMIMNVCCLLASRSGDVVTRDELIDTVWGTKFGSDESLTRAIYLLRKALAPAAGGAVVIETVSKKGYRLVLPVMLANGTPSLPPAPVAEDSRPSLAVLPFANRSGLAEDDVFAMGMVDDVIGALSQSETVRVLSSFATARFAGSDAPDTGTVGRKLGVRYLLEGNVRRAGPDLRVTAQLVEAASGELLWTQKFDRPLAELAGLQEDLVVEVAANLGTQVLRREMARTLKKPVDLTAWECVIRGNAAYRQLDPASLARAIEEARRAVAIDPDYGLGHAMLSGTISVRYFALGREDPDELQEISTHANRALMLDPDNAVSLSYVGAAMAFTGRPEEGLRQTLRATRISPYFGHAYYVCGIACTMLNQIDEALAHFDTALRLDPHGPNEYTTLYRKGRVYLRAQDWAAADAVLAQSIALIGNAPAVLCESAIVARELGRKQEAAEKLARVRELEPGATLADWERRLNRWHENSQTLATQLDHLRVLWGEGDENPA